MHTSEIRLSTGGDADVIDITRAVAGAVAESGIAEGQASAFVRGSTAAITTMEFEPGGVHDLQRDARAADPARAATTSTTDSTTTRTRTPTSVPRSSEPPRWSRSSAAASALGTWQQLVLIDFDDRPRERTVVVQVIG